MVHIAFVGEDFVSAGAVGGEVVGDTLQQALFKVAVAYAAVEVIGHHGGVIGFGGDEFVKGEDAAAFDRFRSFDGGGVGLDAHDLLFERSRLFKQRDGVVVALAHLLAVEAGDDGGGFLDARIGQFEEAFAKGLVHFDGDVAGDLDVLLLILAHRDDIAVVHQNIRRHEHGIGEEAVRGMKAAGDLVLVAVAALQQAHGRDGAENPGKLAVLRHITLAEEDAFRRIKAAGEEIDGEFADVLAQPVAILHGGEGMVVGDEVVGVALMLQLERRLHHAEVIADVKSAAGLKAGKDAHKAADMAARAGIVKPAVCVRPAVRAWGQR